MPTTKYCMDCGHYIAGGGEYNCKADLKFYYRSVSALKPACKLFIEKEEEEKVEFSKLEMRRKPIRRSKK